MTNATTTVIEVNGVKLEVDLRTAKRIDTLQIGSRVKCLVKGYDSYKVMPGVVVGFDPFESRPSITVAYLDVDYSGANLKFQTLNKDTKEFEIVAAIDNDQLEVNRADVLTRMDREIAKKQLEIEDLQQRKAYFLDNFKAYFADCAPSDIGDF